MRTTQSPDGTKIYYLGPDAAKGPLPAFVYFSLSGEESLTLDPYNAPVMELIDKQMRLISLTIPGHGKGFDKFLAIDYWAEQMAAGLDVLTPFFDASAKAINWLVDVKVIDPARLAFGGLSRGAFVAMHIATRVKYVKTLVGYAPMTKLSFSKSFEGLNVEDYDVHNLVGQLDHLQSIRFYMGNRDTLVGTENTFDLMQQLVERDYSKRLKQNIELFLLPSIGRGGHGTTPATFAEGAQWVCQQLGSSHI